MIHFLPKPEMTPSQIRHSRVLESREAPYWSVMIPLYTGIAICAILVSLFLK